MLEKRILLAARFSPGPEVLPDFSEETAALVIAPLLSDSDAHDDDEEEFPVHDEPVEESELLEGPLTNDDTFRLHSNPGSNYTIYLDFDGGITVGTGWNNSTGISPLIDIAYNRDGDSSTFNNSELNQIREIWKLVAEDFAPFDVNVTTEDPGIEALRKSGSGDTQWGIRSLHTSNRNGVCGGCGGVAYIGSFTSSKDLPAYSFNKGISAGGNTQSHEVGHALRLGHDGKSGGTTYYGGHGGGSTSWGPIMGGPGGRSLKTWSNGDYYNANNQQDDLGRISTLNGFSYRADDHGNTFAVATPLEIDSTTNLSGFGIIEQNNDVDLFSFQTSGGNVSFDIRPKSTHRNLDIWAGLYDSTGTLIAESNLSGAVAASFVDVPLAEGEYFLKVDGVGTHGFYNPTLDRVFDPGEADYTGPETQIPWAVASPTGYSDYASLGQYWITGTRAAAATDWIAIQPIEGEKPEGDSGTTTLTFDVSRSGDNGPELQLAYTVATAISARDNNVYPFTVDGDDFVGGSLPSGIVTIPAGQTSATVTVEVSGDADYERDEHFRVIISDPPAGWTISQSTANGTILADESSVGVKSLNTAESTQYEGGPGGGASFTFTLFRRGDLSGTTTANWQVDYSGFSNPTSDDDFAGGVRPGGQVVFDPGESEIDIEIVANGDVDFEVNESFRVEVTGVSGTNAAVIDPATPHQRGIILEDESPVTVIDEVQFRWRQIRHGGGDKDLWAIDNVSLSSSSLVDDFDPDIDGTQWSLVQNGTVNTNDTIFPGSNGQELLMQGTGDRIATTTSTYPVAGATLTFDLIIGNGTGSNGNGADNAENGKDIWLEYSVDGQNWDFLQAMKPNNHEQWTTVAVNLPARTEVTSAVIQEGDSGTSSLQLNIVRTGQRQVPATADWQIVPSGSHPIDINDVDGSSFPSGTVVFGAGDGVETVSIPITGDLAVEENETFELVVTASSSGLITGGPRTITLLDDDQPVVAGVTINDGSDQRSAVNEIHVTFDRLIDVPASAFQLTNKGTQSQPANIPVTDLVVTSVDNGSVTTVTIGLSSGESLDDGNYELDIDGAQVISRTNGAPMAGNYVFGDQEADNFFRKYGDDNGNRVVDLFDFSAFRNTYNKSSGDSLYVDWFDATGDDQINLFDFAIFRNNYGS